MVYTDVKFNISDPIWQKAYDAAEEKARLNVLAFCSRPVLIEGGGYNGIWLETQPMGGEMYAMRNMEAAMNNQLFFMENIRADGRIPSVIRFTGDEKHPLDLMFSHFQGYCFPYHALNMYFLNGHDREYLEMTCSSGSTRISGSTATPTGTAALSHGAYGTQERTTAQDSSAVRKRGREKRHPTVRLDSPTNQWT